MLNFLNIILFLFAFSFLNSARLPHYYNQIYFSFFLLIVYIFTDLKKRLLPLLWKIVFVLFFAGYILVNSQGYYFFYQKGANQIAHSKKVANFLAEKIGNKSFNIATWPVEFTEDNYLYFLELKGFVPADRTKIEITNQMFVLCNKQPCKILDSPSWNISMFGPAKIDKIWSVEDIKIYKLVHQ
jgi:hypothetical protein